MGSKRRLSKQQQQEYRSRDQLADRLDDYGWIPDPISRDLGEDFIVRLYDEGVSTGLDFFVQLKSTDDLTKFKIKGECISYQLDVKDLIHWDSSATPVFLIIWDVIRRTGCWRSLHDAIAELDERKPSWRNQKTVRVRTPCSNKTDDAGLYRIRQYLANYYYPLVAEGRSGDTEFAFTFPDTPEGRATFRALERFQSAGDSVEIGGEFIEEMRFPEWWTRLFGEMSPDEGKLTLFSKPSDQSIPVRIDLTSPDGGMATVPYVDLKRVKSGTDEMTVTNDHQPIPLHFRFVLPKTAKQGPLNLSIQGPGTDVRESRNVVQFMQALAKGGKMRMTFLEVGDVIEATFPAGIIESLDQRLLDLLDDLCFIQREVGCRLTLNQDWMITAEDAATVKRLVKILKTGRVYYSDATFRVDVRPKQLKLMLKEAKRREPARVKMELEQREMQLLGQTISLGPVTRYFTVDAERLRTELETVLSNMGDDDGPQELKLTDLEIREEYHDWLPDREPEA